MSVASRPTRESLWRSSLNEVEVSGDILLIYAGSIGGQIDYYTTPQLIIPRRPNFLSFLA